MKIVADKDIYQVADFFSDYGDLELIPGREISSVHIKDADALLVRTVTTINRELINSSSVRFVASASSGFDHVDVSLLKERGVSFSHAPGCNANAVVDYFFAALALNARLNHQSWQGKSVGIIGAGNVGTRLAKKLIALGLQVAIYDPFLETSHELAAHFSTLQCALEQDVVSLHTALSDSGLHPSYHLLNHELLRILKKEAILINASRGEIIDNDVLDLFLLERPDVNVVLDVWENEPNVKVSLLEKVQIATPHIAGYSLNGKLNGTRMIFNDFCRFFSVNRRALDQQDNKRVLNIELSSDNDEREKLVNNIILSAYPIMHDCISAARTDSKLIADAFDSSRNNYDFRKEFCDYQLPVSKSLRPCAEILSVLGFSLT